MGIFGAALGAAGSVISGLISSSGTAEANKASAQSVLQQEKFQKQMSDTAYQRSVKDLEAAGLNPMLAYSNGPASSPSGASMQFQNPNAGLAAGIGGAVSSAYGAENTASNVENTNWDTDVKKSTDALTSQQATNAEWTGKILEQQAAQSKLQTTLTASAVNAARNASSVASGDFGKVLAYLNAVSSAIHGTASAGSAVRGAISSSP